MIETETMMMNGSQDDAAEQGGAAIGPATGEPTTAQPTTPPSAAPTPPAAVSAPRYSTAYAPAPAPAPIRWGGVVWGLLLTLFAGATMYVLTSAERAAEVALWLRSMTPGSAWALGAAVLGLIIVVSALLGGIRASQRRRIHPRG